MPVNSYFPILRDANRNKYTLHIIAELVEQLTTQALTGEDISRRSGPLLSFNGHRALQLTLG